MIWNPDRRDLFWRFVAERHEMFRRRVLQKLPPPWTKDEALVSGRFTNVYRELDRGTRYLITRILPHADRSPLSTLFSVLVYRQFNRIETHEALAPGGFLDYAEEWDREKARATLRRLRKQGPIFNSAYIISPGGKHGDKITIVLRQLGAILKQLVALHDTLIVASDMQAAHRILCTLPGIAGFVAYEIVVDLCYGQAILPFTENDFVHLGPGAVRGINLLLTEPVPSSMRAQPLIRGLWAGQKLDRAAAGAVLHGPNLTLRNIEHSLCEFQKYWRITTTGHGRRKFSPAEAKTDLSLWDDLPAIFT